MRIGKNESGFTLVESMIALAALTLILGLFPLVLKAVDLPAANDSMNEWETVLFFQQVKTEILTADAIAIGGKRLDLRMRDGTVVGYVFKNGKLVRKVNGRGSVWLLQHVRDVRFARVGKGVSIVVEGTKGRKVSHVFLSYASQAK
ncbi:MAG TPA: ComGF family competence protein [Bacillales bacterium]|nr:ComGF family competence protein [Bacillales bacterium]